MGAALRCEVLRDGLEPRSTGTGLKVGWKLGL
jgi:hypothetical protein